MSGALLDTRCFCGFAEPPIRALALPSLPILYVLERMSRARLCLPQGGVTEGRGFVIVHPPR